MTHIFTNKEDDKALIYLISAVGGSERVVSYNGKVMYDGKIELDVEYCLSDLECLESSRTFFKEERGWFEDVYPSYFDIIFNKEVLFLNNKETSFLFNVDEMPHKNMKFWIKRFRASYPRFKIKTKRKKIRLFRGYSNSHSSLGMSWTTSENVAKTFGDKIDTLYLDVTDKRILYKYDNCEEEVVIDPFYAARIRFEQECMEKEALINLQCMGE